MNLKDLQSDIDALLQKHGLLNMGVEIEIDRPDIFSIDYPKTRRKKLHTVDRPFEITIRARVNLITTIEVLRK